MSAMQTTLLGLFAGATIFIGLPIGRIERLSARMRAFLTVLSAGILLFIFWDVVTASTGMVEESMSRAQAGGSWTRFWGEAMLLAGGFALGAFGLAYAERAVMRRRPLPPMSGGSSVSVSDSGLDAAAIAEQARRAALTLGMLIAVAIGIHNFSEGLAIGVAARGGEIALAGTLIIGFALHNATEGFGIIGPMAGEEERPSWGFLALLGLIGGGPTFVGTLVGHAWVSQALEVAFFGIAAGSILYVVIQLIEVCRRYTMPTVVAWWILAGLVVGFATDFVLVAAGA
jgi:ZIP family zinc transporter